MRKTLILLGILNDSDVDWMLRAGGKRRVEAGGQVIAEGRPVDSVFIVLSGSFGVIVGGRERVARLLPGDIVGEMSFVDSRPPSASVLADEESWLLAIPREAVRERLDSDEGFTGRFYRAVAVFLSLRLRETLAGLTGARTTGVEESGVEDADEILEDMLERVAIAGHRFGILEQRARVTQ